MKKYKLTFLGVNSFFSNGIDQFHSNLFLENEDGKALLIDCGTDIKMSLAKAGKKVENIDAVYISHLHGDHCGGLEWLGFYTHFITKKKPKLYTDFTHLGLFYGNIWEMLRPSMEVLDHGNVKLGDYFDIAACDNFEWDNANFCLIPLTHVKNHETDIFSYGLFFEINGKKVLFSSDTSKNLLDYIGDHDICNYREKYINNADIIFHDCETYGLVMPPGSKVHAHYEDLTKSDPRVKEKTWLYHYQDLGDKMPDACRDGFAGFVKTGQVFEF